MATPAFHRVKPHLLFPSESYPVTLQSTHHETVANLDIILVLLETAINPPPICILHVSGWPRIKSGAFGQALRPVDKEPVSLSFPVSLLDLQRSLSLYPLINSLKFVYQCVPGSSRISVVKLPQLR